MQQSGMFVPDHRKYPDKIRWFWKKSKLEIAPRALQIQNDRSAGRNLKPHDQQSHGQLSQREISQRHPILKVFGGLDAVSLILLTCKVQTEQAAAVRFNDQTCPVRVADGSNDQVDCGRSGSNHAIACGECKNVGAGPERGWLAPKWELRSTNRSSARLHHPKARGGFGTGWRVLA